MEKLDVVILGATGFSGKYVVKTLSRVNCGVKWGIAGRSINKLKSLMQMSQELTKNPPALFICDVTDKDSVAAVCKLTKVLVNCAGPYMGTGHAVVEACIENGTHYIDITVEINYILDITRKYHKLAEDANVLVIPACGLVSVVPVMGLMYLDDNFPGTLKSVETYITPDLPKEILYPNSKNCIMHATSLHTLLDKIRNKQQYDKNAKELLPEINMSNDIRSFFRNIFYRNGKIWIPYIFPDESVAVMSQQYLNVTENKPYIPFKTYFAIPITFFFIMSIIFALIYYALSYFEWFLKMLAKYPRFFTLGYITHEGPDEDVLSKAKGCMVLEGKGYRADDKDSIITTDKSMNLKISFPNGYQTTADAVIASVLTILKESVKMPRGGVVNCGAAFRRTNIVQRLQELGIKFEIVKA